MGTRVLHTAALVLFILCLPVMLFTASVSTAMNCRWLYDYDFHKYDIASVTGLAPSELKKAAEGLIHYFNSGEEYVNIVVIKDGQPFTLFNEREVQHLKDVKGIFRLVYKLLIGTGTYALLYASLMLALRQDRRRLAGGLLYGSGLSILLMIILGVLAITDFHWLFWQFHLASFSNDMWLLDPTRDYLIMLFPEGFWMDAAIICSAFKIFLALILGGVGWWILKKNPLKSA
ncbi:MAG: TIGR01906 family membrane protein [Dehalococcoidales bacterium]|jgi:integral membrane protein (TIGR01906 family)